MTVIFDVAISATLSDFKTFISQNNLSNAGLIKDGVGMSLIHYAAQGGNIEVFRYLIEQGADVDIESYTKWTALHMAAKYGKVEMMTFLLENGSTKLEAKNMNGHAPIHLAIQESNTI